jgi:hypothetical protein
VLKIFNRLEVTNKGIVKQENRQNPTKVERTENTFVSELKQSFWQG